MGLNIAVTQGSDEAIFKLSGELDAAVAPQLKAAVEKAAVEKPKRLVFDVSELEFMASAGLRVLIFAKQKMGAGVSLYLVGSRGPVLNTLTMSGFHHSVILQDAYFPTE
jgi:anti-anti-sigma factor